MQHCDHYNMASMRILSFGRCHWACGRFHQGKEVKLEQCGWPFFR